MTAPFTVLHVCTGNICRSPMSERILDGLTGDDVLNHGSGISGYHQGDPMEPEAAHELDERGFESRGHRARHIDRAQTESADLILVATTAHREYIAERFAEAVGKTFTVRQFGRIAADVLAGAAAAELPVGDAAIRGKALVALAAERRDDYPEIELADPWGLGRAVFSQVADQLEDALEPVAEALDGGE